MTKTSSAPMLRSQLLRPNLAAVLVAAGTAFGLTGCSDSGDPEGTGGTGGVGGSTSVGGMSGKAGSATTGGAGAGGASTAGTGGKSAGGAGGTMGGTSAGGTSTSGGGGSTGGAGAGGAGAGGMGGSMGGAGASAGGTAGASMGGAGMNAGGNGAGMSGAAGSGGGGMEDLDMQAEDFECIADWDQVLGFRINNLLGHLPEALTVANSDTGGVYPVGTIIQHLPTEAMVKRRTGFSPETKDWEFFVLQISASGTTITDRGTTEIETSMGATCVSCHTLAPDEFDFVCNTWGDQGGDNCGFDFGESMLNMQINNDPRCD